MYSSPEWSRRSMANTATVTLSRCQLLNLEVVTSGQPWRLQQPHEIWCMCVRGEGTVMKQKKKIRNKNQNQNKMKMGQASCSIQPSDSAVQSGFFQQICCTDCIPQPSDIFQTLPLNGKNLAMTNTCQCQNSAFGN